MDKKGLIGMIVIAGILLVVGFFWFVGETNLNEESIECVKIQTTCCPCNMGGEEQCVLASEVTKYKENLSECLENGVCIAMFNCQIESCEYVDGECVVR
ncbi:MAG: hypothetical protein ABIH79_01775 [archaeon]